MGNGFTSVVNKSAGSSKESKSRDKNEHQNGTVGENVKENISGDI